jgi:hypothetical protein
LIDHLLLGRFVPFPTPGNLAESDHDRHRQHIMGRPANSNGIHLRVLKNGKDNGQR